MLRVWFNHWFSTSYGLIELLKKDSNHEVYVIASNKQIDSVIQKVCDEWYQDSLADGEEYIEYCLDFCREYKVDVFIPRRKMEDISRGIDRFRKIGVKVMVDDYQIMKILNDKVAAYDFLRDCPGVHIPDYAMVNTADEFKEAYARLHEKYEQICVKFVKDEGAMSYRRIIDHVDRVKRLRVYPGAEVSYDDYTAALAEAGRFDDLMVMPYLPGEEISVDCLNTAEGLIAVPRYKGNARHERIVYDSEILDAAKNIMEKVKLEYPCNIQFKFKDNIPYLLEINTRMSGGLQMTCLGADINIPAIALNKLLGMDVEWKINPVDRVVSYIEIPQIIR